MVSITVPVAAPRWSWLPAIGTWKYHALLVCLGIFVLGPLGGVTASFMNFSLGFFVGGQVLAGILAPPSPSATAPRASTAPTTCRPRRPPSPA
jgi:hypothetical protein